MDVLCPIDGSKCSFRALEFAIDFTKQYEGSLRVVHITDSKTDATEKILNEARDVLAESGLETEPELEYDLNLRFRSADRIGKDIVALVEEEGFDHIVMGHHGSGAVEKAILGSATQTVIKQETVPTTIVS